MKSRAIVAAAVLSTALISGGWLMQRGSRGGSPDLAASTQLFDAVMQHLKRDYVDSLSDSVLYRRAVSGALRELHDAPSVFLDPRRVGQLQESTTGQYAGVGIQMDVRDSGITVAGVLPGTPAEQAGILMGDRIISIDGKPTLGLTADEALKVMRGEDGSQAKIIIERPGIAEHMPFALTRRVIDVNPVRHALLLNDGVGYVDLTVFSAKAGAALAAAIDSLRTAGATSLVLDLRGDPGGLLDQGIGVADLFLDQGQAIVSTRGRTAQETQSFADRAPQRWPDVPLVVLADSNTASASEIVAGALQDHDRAVIIGTTSYGKGSAQRLFPVSDQGAVKLTIALWYTPSGRSISKHKLSASDDANTTGRPTADANPRPRFRTDAGRTVLGGGGIVPDIEVASRTNTPQDKALQSELGGRIVKFRDAITAYVMSLRASKTITSPEFVVTPAMRDELYRRVTERGVPLTRATYDADSALVTRVLTGQIARYVFGANLEFSRALRDDAALLRAAELLKGVHSQHDLLARIPATPAR